jgi:hypothetical protein
MIPATLTAAVAEVKALRGLPVTGLQDRYDSGAGRATRSRNREWLMEQITREITRKSLARGLGAAGRRALARAVRRALAPARPRLVGREARHDPRIPPVGSVLRRRHRDRVIEVKVTRTGFTWEGRAYRSLSRIAREATGQRWNGLLWFGFRPRQRGPRPGRRAT